MSTEAAPPRQELLAFIDEQDTVDTLSMAQHRLNALNADYDQLASDDNPKSKTHPFEGTSLLSIDDRPTDRASALLHAASEATKGLEVDERLSFYKENVSGRRVILSQSALQASIDDGEKNRYQTFHDSKMNPGKQMVWAQPLVHKDKIVAAVQLAFTLNRKQDWNYQSNDGVDKVWEKHRRSMAEVAKSLADLALKTSSLSKSLEIMPPVAPNAFVIEWDVVNSRVDALNHNYARLEAYLEKWKAARAEITKGFNATILDRGDGEFIILPFEHLNLNDPIAVRQYSQRKILPVVYQLMAKHDEISKLYLPDIYKQINVTVAAGNIEEDQDGKPTGQVLYQLKDLADTSAKSLVFSPAAEKILF